MFEWDVLWFLTLVDEISPRPPAGLATKVRPYHRVVICTTVSQINCGNHRPDNVGTWIHVLDVVDDDFERVVPDATGVLLPVLKIPRVVINLRVVLDTELWKLLRR